MTCAREVRTQRIMGPVAIMFAICLGLVCMPAHGQQDQSTTAVPTMQDSAAQTDGGQLSASGAESQAPGEQTTSVQSSNAPSAVNLETGLPLRTLMSPIHWGHFSIFSASMIGSYDSNYTQSSPPQGAQSTFFNGLVVYALRHRKTQVDLQYMPTVWAGNGNVQSDFTNQAIDGFTSFDLSRKWSLNLHDTFRYAPQQFVWTTPTFSPDFTTNTATANPFMLIGQNSLMNNFNAALGGRLGERNQVSFAYTESFIKLSPQSNETPGSIYSVGDREDASALTASWSRNLTRRNSVNISYGFERMYERAFAQTTQFQNVSLGYTRVLRPTVSVSLEGGPGWATTHSGIEPARTTRTAQGSLSLFKAFREGGIAASFSRSNTFVGVISNNYNNRYDLSLTRRLFRRVQAQLGYGYVQQELTTRKRLDSGIGYASLAYSLTRNWSVFGSYDRLTFAGSQIPYPRRAFMGAGIRWAWTPKSQNQ